MDEMVAYWQRWRVWGKEIGGRHLAGPPPTLSTRLAVQIILTRAMWHAHLATGRACFNKHAVAERLADEVPDYRFLEGVRLATKVRVSHFAPGTAATLDELRRWAHRLQQWGETEAVDAVPRGPEIGIGQDTHSARLPK